MFSLKAAMPFMILLAGHFLTPNSVCIEFAGDSQQILREGCRLIILAYRTCTACVILNDSQGSMVQGLSLLDSHQIWIAKGVRDTRGRVEVSVKGAG